MTHEDWIQRGISQGIYSVTWPQAQEVIKKVWSDADALVSEQLRTWSKKQESAHESFASQWVSFANQEVDFNPKGFPYFYPTAGSSEAIREILVSMKVKGSSLVVFEGEYEGYASYAKALGMSVTSIPRSEWRERLPALFESGHELFISNPSAMDGELWEDWEPLRELSASWSGARIHLDLCYVGAMSAPKRFQTEGAAIQSVIFSLSKVFGVYYQRIGGAWLKEPNELLWGNRWFKSLPAMKIGEELMKAFAPSELPRRWEPERLAAIQEVEKENGWALRPAAVSLIATSESQGLESMRRKGQTVARVCLTPAWERKMEAAWRAKGE